MAGEKVGIRRRSWIAVGRAYCCRGWSRGRDASSCKGRVGAFGTSASGTDPEMRSGHFQRRLILLIADSDEASKVLNCMLIERVILTGLVPVDRNRYSGASSFATHFKLNFRLRGQVQSSFHKV